MAKAKKPTKKPTNKKPANKKPANKKPANKKPANKKPAKKKPTKKKPAFPWLDLYLDNVAANVRFGLERSLDTCLNMASRGQSLLLKLPRSPPGLAAPMPNMGAPNTPRHGGTSLGCAV